MQRLTGKEVAAAIMADTKERAEKLASAGKAPCLAVFRVGERPDDVAYEASIKRHCERAAVECRLVTLPADVAQQDFADALAAAAADPTVHGMFFFSPLPKSLDEDALRALIPVEKDVDCLSEASAAAVFCGSEGFAPCTPSAVMEMLRYYEVPLSGKRAVVLGRSMVVGKPLAMLLLAADATVTVCHSRSKDLPALCREADIVLAAVGRPRLVQGDWLRDGQVVLDVGVNADPENPGKICGDVNFADAEEIVAAASPVPGGVGLVTTAVLCRHVVEAAERL